VLFTQRRKLGRVRWFAELVLYEKSNGLALVVTHLGIVDNSKSFHLRGKQATAERMTTGKS
jgi:hypothetical protein